MLMRVSFFVLLLQVFSFSLLAVDEDAVYHKQEDIIKDSLLLVISNGGEDSLFVSACILLGERYRNSFTDSSEYYLLKALEISKRKKYKLLLADVYNQLGILYYVTARYSDAIDNMKKAVEIYERFGNKERVSDILNNIGLVYIDLNKFEYAINYLNRTIKIKQELNDEYNTALAFLNLGAVYLNMGNDSLALNSFNKSIPVYSKYLTTKDSLQALSGLAYSFNNLAQIFEKKGEVSIAIKYYKKAIRYLEKINDLNNLNLAYVNIAGAQLKLLDFNSNKSNEELLLKDIKGYIDKAIKQSKEINDLNNLFLSYRALSVYYEKVGDYKNAHLWYIKYTTLKDSILNQQSISQIESSEERYQNLLKQAELDNQKELIKSQQKLIRMGAVALFVVTFLIVLIVVYLRRDRRQNKKIQEINKNLNDSIKIASIIQRNVLKEFKNIGKFYSNFFVFYKPKELVGGDFIFEKKIGDNSFVAVADCVGHGIPGAMVSMLSYNIIHEILKKQNANLDLGKLLTLLRESVLMKFFSDKNALSQIGLDISLIKFNKVNMTLEYAGANLPIYIVSNNEMHQTGRIKLLETSISGKKLFEIKPDRMPIGKYEVLNDFSSVKIKLSESDRIFMFSDGFADQFGGHENKKYKYHNFKKLLLRSSDKDLKSQKNYIIEEFYSWKGRNEQVDDVTVLGLEI